MAHGHEDKYWPLGIPAHYGKVWFILCILFAVSYIGPLWIAPEAKKLGGETVGKVVLMSTAFGIAIWKAGLVVKEFMHLPLEKKFIWYIEGVVVAFMLLFFFAVAPDVMRHEGRNWENRAAAAVVEKGMKEGAAAEAAGGHHGAAAPTHEGAGHGAAAPAHEGEKHEGH
jgi:hypothetical protein